LSEHLLGAPPGLRRGPVASARSLATSQRSFALSTGIMRTGTASDDATTAAGPVAEVAAPLMHEEHPLGAVVALGTLAAAAFCFVTNESVPVGLQPSMARSLHVSIPAIGLLVTTYAVVVAVMSVPLTHLTKGLPRRQVLAGVLGTFALAALGSSFTNSYWWLMAMRLVMAFAHSVFWSIAAVTATSLFPARIRARAIAGVLGGGSVAVVLGVPAATWLGQEGGWHLPFLVLSGLGMALGAACLRALPQYHPQLTHASAGSEPDRCRYVMVTGATVLVVTGYFCTYTYISTFLERVSHLVAHSVPTALLVAGLGSIVGVVGGGSLFDRHPKFATVAPVAALTAAMAGLFVLGASPWAAVGLSSVASLALTAFNIANQNRILIVAPGSTDVANAWASAAFNVGIAAGSLGGGAVLGLSGPRAIPAFGVIALAAGLFLAVKEVRRQ
jgi:DHA1 family inner membrane transport protein